MAWKQGQADSSYEPLLDSATEISEFSVLCQHFSLLKVEVYISVMKTISNYDMLFLDISSCEAIFEMSHFRKLEDAPLSQLSNDHN